MGYASRLHIYEPRPDGYRETRTELRRHLKETCKDRGLLLSIVSGGVHLYLQNARHAFARYPLVDDQVLYECFAYFASRAGENPNKALDRFLRCDDDAWSDVHKYGSGGEVVKPS